MDKRYLAIGVLAGVIALLLLFGSGQRADAGTFKIRYSTQLSCNGPDGVASTPDDSCAAGTAYNASTIVPPVPVTADILSKFSIPAATPPYSNYALLRAFGIPSTWKLATDKQIPDGAAVGKVVSISTLALFGGQCNVVLQVTIPMYDCTTDNSTGNLIAWGAANNGANLLEGDKGGLPKGCTKYPDFLNLAAGGVKPRARYFGTTVVTDNMSPTQLQFLMFTPQQQAPIGDEQGYVNFVVLNNPAVPAPAGDALDEFCTPLESNATLWGLTGGQGGLTQKIGPLPSNPPPVAAGSFWTVGDTCANTTDDDGDSVINEMCGIQRVANPANVLIPQVGGVAEAGAQCCNAVDEDSDGVLDDACSCSGLWNTRTHLDGAYAESYRDADGDTITNNEDECPFQVDIGQDPDGDRIDSVCDPTPGPGPGNQDPDADGWRAQQDNCPLVFQVNQNDTDGDGIGDICDFNPSTPDGNYLNDQPGGGICVGAADADGDGWCDATEAINPGGGVLSLGIQVGGLALEADRLTAPYAAPQCSNGLDDDGDGYVDAADAGCKVPEYKALDYAIVAANNPPGAAPRTCNNYSYYSTSGIPPNGGVLPEVDDDGDTTVNALDPNCVVIAGDNDQDGVVNASDNCINVWNPTQLDTDRSCGTLGSPGQGGTTDSQPNNCGDACDTDDDADNRTDVVEWAAGNDAKNVCDPINFDNSPNGIINAADIIAFYFPTRLVNRPCSPPTNYNWCR